MRAGDQGPDNPKTQKLKPRKIKWNKKSKKMERRKCLYKIA